MAQGSHSNTVEKLGHAAEDRRPELEKKRELRMRWQASARQFPVRARGRRLTRGRHLGNSLPRCQGTFTATTDDRSRRGGVLIAGGGDPDPQHDISDDDEQCSEFKKELD
jgi:hypothetical protein